MSLASGKYNAHEDFFLSAPYNRVLVQRLKMRVPSKFRTYRGETKTWTILAPYGNTACAILLAEYPDATITNAAREAVDRSKLPPAPIDLSRALKESVTPVLQRDNRRCVYCGEPAAQVDQWQAGIPSPDTLVASCLTCHILGRDAYFTTIHDKRVWLHEQTQAHIIHEAREEPPTDRAWKRGTDAPKGAYANSHSMTT